HYLVNLPACFGISGCGHGSLPFVMSSGWSFLSMAIASFSGNNQLDISVSSLRVELLCPVSLAFCSPCRAFDLIVDFGLNRGLPFYGKRLLWAEGRALSGS